MRKMFQDQWHGIKFRDFAVLSSRHLAGADFYEAFYREFFTRYHAWSDLDPSWMARKLKVALLLEERLAGRKEARVLSVSCGLGVIEKALWDRGYRMLDIMESSDQPLGWIRVHVTADRMFVGAFPDCLPAGRMYDMIYLSAAEYFLDQKELIILLRKVRGRLVKGGKCVLISASYASSGLWDNSILLCKDAVKYLLEVLGVRSRGQFWGYTRNRKDLHGAMRSAGFLKIEDGMLGGEEQHSSYWIEGQDENS